MWSLDPSLLGGTSAVVIIILFVGCLYRGMDLDYNISASPTHLIVYPLLINIFNYTKYFLLVFMSFSLIIAL